MAMTTTTEAGPRCVVCGGAGVNSDYCSETCERVYGEVAAIWGSKGPFHANTGPCEREGCGHPGTGHRLYDFGGPCRAPGCACQQYDPRPTA